MRGKVTGIRSIIGRHKIDRGEVKNRTGNREAKELICTTHGHEPKEGWQECWRVGGAGWWGDKGEKKIGTTVIA